MAKNLTAWLLLPLVLLITAACDSGGRAAAPKARLAEGQVWSYKTRPGEEGSRIHIVRVDNFPDTPSIYHLHVDGLALRNLKTPTGTQDHLHLPVAEKALRLSVVELVEANEATVPDISKGYGIWREAYDKDEAGYFSISLPEIIDYIESTVSGSSEDE